MQVPSLLLIAQVVFILEHGYTNTQTLKVPDATDDPTDRASERRGYR